MEINYKNKETGRIENIDLIKSNFDELKANTNEFNNLEFDDFLNEFYENININKIDFDTTQIFNLFNNSINYLKEYSKVLENYNKILIENNNLDINNKEVIFSNLEIQDIKKCIKLLSYMQSKGFEIKENGN